MRLIGVTTKLFLAILSAFAVVLVANAIAGRISFERDFLGYLNDQGVERMREVIPRVQAAYRHHGNWDFLRGHPDIWFAFMRPEHSPDLPSSEVPPISDQTGAIPRFALFDASGLRLIGNPEAGKDAIRLPIDVDGKPVGWLAMVPFQKAIAAGDVRFYQAQLRFWWVNGAISVVVAALLAWLLSHALLRRVRGIATAVHQLADGNYTHRNTRIYSDELGQLSMDIDQLAATLQNIELNRQGFMADISHELRTPLAVLRAELEAIQDGIRPISQAGLESLLGQVQQLSKLVNDLSELSVTQTGELSYHFAPIDLHGVLENALTGMRGRIADAGLRLTTEFSQSPQLIRGDERRLQQLFINLLENSIRYTANGGQMVVKVQRAGNRIQATIEDSAPGVPPEQRGRLFERFYRVEGSRSRTSGGSGLGLAICRNIVQAHGGSISADASALGGLCVTISFPRQI